KRHSTWRFFFQAEDGIRDFHVTGVQTCALPISVRPDDLEPDGAVTVWPEGHTDAADAPTLLIRFRDDQDFQPRPGREGWTVGNLVAYSKICTHVGCPVGLYQSNGLLLCPCHQSTFD